MSPRATSAGCESLEDIDRHVRLLDTFALARRTVVSVALASLVSGIVVAAIMGLFWAAQPGVWDDPALLGLSAVSSFAVMATVLSALIAAALR